MYKLGRVNQFYGGECVLRLSDNAYIPFDPTNTDYQAYLKWLDGYELQFNPETMSGQWVKTSEGNEPLPADEGTE
jgi:hypothetical protein